MFLYVLCCTYFFKYTHLSPGTFSFFSLIYNTVFSPLESLVHVFTQTNLCTRNEQRTTAVSPLFCLLSYDKSSLPFLSFFFTFLLFLLSKQYFHVFVVLCCIRISVSSQSPYTISHCLKPQHCLSSQLFRHLNEREIFQGGNCSRNHGQVAGLRNLCMSVHLVLLFFSPYPVF